MERALPAEYLAILELALDRLSEETLEHALEIARLPDLIRGYEDIKLESVERFRGRSAELRTALEA